MTAADTAAVKAIVESAGALAGHVFVTRTTDTAQSFPYVVLHPAEGAEEQTRASGPRLTEHPEFTLHVVSDSAESVQIVVALLKAKFHSNGFATAPTVSGRRNYNAYWRSPLPVQVDKDVTPWLLWTAVELGWSSDPA